MMSENEVLYFILGIISMLVIWFGFMMLCVIFEKDTTRGFDEWLNMYESMDSEIPNKHSPNILLGGDSAYCFITGNFIGADVIDNGDAKYTKEFDSWVSKEGQKILHERNDNEAKIILEEWENNDERNI